MKRWKPWTLVVLLPALAGGVWWRVSGDVCEYRASLPAVQLTVVASALDAWRSDNGRYPQHLDALLSDGPARLGPYLRARDLIDFRHRPLIYSPSADGSAFTLSSLGADGKTGGEGQHADVVIIRPEADRAGSDPAGSHPIEPDPVQPDPI